MTPPLMRGTGTVKRRARGRVAKGRGRGPIDVGAVQVAPLIAPQRVQLCGPSAITAHSARHLTPPVPPCRLNPLHPSSPPPSPPGFQFWKPTNQPTRFCPVPARDISPGLNRGGGGRGGGYRVFLFKCTPWTCRRAPADLNAIRGTDAI